MPLACSCQQWAEGEQRWQQRRTADGEEYLVWRSGDEEWGGGGGANGQLQACDLRPLLAAGGSSARRAIASRSRLGRGVGGGWGGRPAGFRLSGAPHSPPTRPRPPPPLQRRLWRPAEPGPAAIVPAPPSRLPLSEHTRHANASRRRLSGAGRLWWSSRPPFPPQQLQRPCRAAVAMGDAQPEDANEYGVVARVA